jgi:outer membrane murein-binding lipoprotein Lpp
MRFKLFAAVILLATMFSGCVSEGAYTGTFKLDKTPS